jgi:hypothetical protein
MAKLVINNRDAASTGVSLFFLTHGYYVEQLELTDDLRSETTRSLIQVADDIVRKLWDATEWA